MMSLLELTISHMQAPLNRYTFKSGRIKEWVESWCDGYVLNLFAGKTMLSVNEYRNDIRDDMSADSHLDALEFVRTYDGSPFDVVLLDPPYSYRKSMEMYDGAISSPFNQLKNEIPNILSPSGRVITLGYHSVVMGRSRGFILVGVCVISHGGAIHDTIISVEDLDTNLFGRK